MGTESQTEAAPVDLGRLRAEAHNVVSEDPVARALRTGSSVETHREAWRLLTYLPGLVDEIERIRKENHRFGVLIQAEWHKTEKAEAERDELAGKFKTAHEAGTELWNQLGAARDVIRRYRDGWTPGKSMAVVLAGSPRPEPEPIWMSTNLRRDAEPMTSAERAALDAAGADET